MGSQDSGDGTIAVVASRAVVLVIVVQGTLSMLTQVNDELGPAQRAAGVVTGLVAAGLFLVVQQRTLGGRAVPAALAWGTVLSASGAFLAAAWLNAALALGVIALRLRGWPLVAAGGGYAVLVAVFMLQQEVNPLVAAFLLLVVGAVGLMLHVLTRLAVTVTELARARETVARLRVDEERQRISRDLHDVLGRSLVAVGLRVQTAVRLLERDPQRCAEQLDEVARMVSDGQARLRGLTRGPTVTGLVDELAAATDIVERLGIRCSAEVSPGVRLTATVDTLGARVLREAVTNLLKHSRPSLVEIGLHPEPGTTVLVITNDGVLEAGRPPGTGLADLGERVGAIGGSLDAEYVPGGRFRVVCTLPTAVAPDSAGAGDRTGVSR